MSKFSGNSFVSGFCLMAALLSFLSGQFIIGLVNLFLSALNAWIAAGFRGWQACEKEGAE